MMSIRGEYCLFFSLATKTELRMATGIVARTPSHTFLEGHEVSPQDGGIDVEERLCGGEGDVVHTEQGDEAGVHLVPATTSLVCVCVCVCVEEEGKVCKCNKNLPIQSCNGTSISTLYTMRDHVNKPITIMMSWGGVKIQKKIVL